MTSSNTINCVVSLIRKRLKSHLKERDQDGFYICWVQDRYNTEIAPKGEYLGTEEERLKAYENLEEERDKAECDYCNLCKEILKIASPPTNKLVGIRSKRTL